MKKVAIITCYFDPDYVRARSIRAALAGHPGLDSIVVKNRHKGFIRYIEILFLLGKLRLKHKPDVYLLTFRGQEILPLVLLTAGKKPVVFDEFIVPLAYAQEKHARTFANTAKHLLASISSPLYKIWLNKCEVILADTTAHAELSAELSGVPLNRYLALPVGTDETVFSQLPYEPRKPFQVFYYGNMLPLHGVSTVMEAADILKDHRDIEFLFVGGKTAVASTVETARQNGARITYKSWIPFEELPAYIAKAGICMGGPFGGTNQAQHVITGKTYQFLASGMPTVVGANKTTGLFRDRENCLLVPQGDPQALAQSILWAYENQDKLAKLGMQGRKLYDAHFSNKVIADLLGEKLLGLS